MALDHDGTDDRVLHGNISGISGAANLTVSVWLNIAGDENLAGYVGKSGSGSRAFALYRAGVAALEMGIHLTGGEASQPETTGDQIILNRWQHWGFVFDGAGATDAARVKLYRDGILLSLTYPAATPTVLDTDAEQVWTGNESDAFNFVFGDVTVAHYMIWAVSFTAGEVARQMNSYYPIRTAPLLWAPYDDGGRARDYSGRGNHGTVTGALFVGGPPQIGGPRRFLATKHSRRRVELGSWGHRVSP